MKSLVLAATLLAACGPSLANGLLFVGYGVASPGAAAPGGGPVAFSLPNCTPTCVGGSVDPIHYVAPQSGTPASGWAVGSDGNSGLDQLHPWGSSAHALHCGDVLIAAPGNYANDEFSDVWTTPTTCPSTSGGIDGAGGVWMAILLCSGDLHSCQVSGNGGLSNPNAFLEFTGGQSNWAIEGFWMDGGTTQQNNGFGYRTCSVGSFGVSKEHHLAFINSVGYHLGQMVASNDCGNPDGTAEGGDYIASVGLLAVNSNEFANFSSFSSGAIAPGALTNWDTNAGTHIFTYNNYGPSNIVHGADTTFDGEFIYYDTFDVHHFSQQVVTANNLSYITTRWCYAVTYGNVFSGATATFKYYNNSCLNAWDSASAGTPGGNIDFTNNECCPPANPVPSHYVVQNNVSVTTFTSGVAPGGATVYALNLQGLFGSLTFGGTGNENVLISTVPSCTAGDCDTTNFAATDQATTYPTGTNLYPAQGTTIYSNVADLANRIGAPNCTGFTTTTACLGWNANTGALTANTFIADMQCVYGQCANHGFQLPSTTCANSSSTGWLANLFADYPIWLKGIVYLHWNGTSITENQDLATKPCGM
jgi:hypothetical protein